MMVRGCGGPEIVFIGLVETFTMGFIRRNCIFVFDEVRTEAAVGEKHPPCDWWRSFEEEEDVTGCTVISLSGEVGHFLFTSFT